MNNLVTLLAVIALQTILVLRGGEATPIHPREASAAECTGHLAIPQNVCSIIDNVRGQKTTNLPDDRIFDISIPLQNSINDAEEMLSAAKSFLPPLQNLQAVPGNCSYRLTPQSGDSSYPYCHWEYNCEYNPLRIPQYLCKAECRESCNHCPLGYACKTIEYKVPVLHLSQKDRNGNCNPYTQTDRVIQWNWSQEIVPVACACQKVTQTQC